MSANNPETTELLKQLQLLRTQEDYVAINNILYKLAYIDSDLAVYEAEQNYNSNSYQNSPRAKAYYTLALGRILTHTGHIPEGHSYMQELQVSLLHYELSDLQKELLPQTYHTLITIAYQRRQMEECLELAQKGLQVIQQLDDSPKKNSLLLLFHCNAFYAAGEIDQPQLLDQHQEAALKLYLEHEDQLLPANRLYFSQHYAYQQLLKEKHETAYQYLQKGQIILEKESIPNLIQHKAINEYYLALYYDAIGDTEKALSFLEDAEPVMEKYKMNELKLVYEQKVSIYKETKDYARALDYQEKFHHFYIQLMDERKLQEQNFTEYQFKLQREQYEKEQALKTAQAKEEFFLNITHDFRSALSLVISPLEGALNDDSSHPNTRQAIQTALKGGQSLLELSNQLLEINKLRDGQLELNEQLVNWPDEVLLFWQNYKAQAASKGIRFSYQANVKTLLAPLDTSKLHRILNNLLSNAVKFTDEGETIQLSVHYYKQESLLEIEVEDTGAGIPSKDLENIFERFYQSEVSYGQGGIGLGLSIVHQLCKLMGIELQLDSELGQGSSFKLRIPTQAKRYELEELKIENQQAPLTPTSTKNSDAKANLLLIDDNLDILNYLQQLLSQEGYHCHALSSARGVNKQIEQQFPDLIISDVMMPELDGMAFAQQLKSNVNTSHIPLILLSALPESSHRQIGLEHGADAYLMKPVGKEVLLTQIERLLSYKQSLKAHYQQKIATSGGIQLDETEKKSVDDQFLEEVINSIDKHMHEDQFGVEVLSELMHMHKRTLYRKVNKLLGISINELIRKRRLHKAKLLIENGSCNIKEAAMTVGFSNISYFTKCFKEEFGLKPSKVKSNTQ